MKGCPWTSYRENGLVSLKGTYKNDERFGPWVSYNDDGTVDLK